MDDLQRTHDSLNDLKNNLTNLDKMMTPENTDKESLRLIRNALLELNSELKLIMNTMSTPT